MVKTVIHAVAGDRIEVSIEALNPDETVFVYFLDSKQHDLVEGWKPGDPVTSMPLGRTIILKGENLSAFISVPHEYNWLIVVDAEASKKPYMRLQTSNNAV